MRPRFRDLFWSTTALACAARMSCLLSSAHAAESNLPAVLLAGCEGATCGYEVATRLFQAGFALNADHEPLGVSPLTLERLRKYSAVVLFGLGYANADMSLGKAQKTVDALNRYLDAGGGVLVMGFFSQQHVLAVDGQSSHCLSAKIRGNLVSSLPITVSHLKDRWSACLNGRDRKKARPIGAFEGKAWATVNISGQADLFVGRPVLVDNPELFLQVTQSGKNAWTIEVHNPTDAAIATSIRANPAFDPLRNAVLPAGPVTIPAGGSMICTL